jgi:hypothetical protein
VFEGRDGAGKGGTIKAITERGGHGHEVGAMVRGADGRQEARTPEHHHPPAQ